MLTDLYDLASIAPGDFHDITQGNNGFPAGPGYDLVTGLGTPKANLLIPDLAAFGLASKATIVTQPPPSVVAGASFGIIAAATDSFGAIDLSYNGTATLSLASGPSGATLHAGVRPGHRRPGGLHEPVAEQEGHGYTFQVAMTGLTSTDHQPRRRDRPDSRGGLLLSAALVDNSLGAAVAAADSNGDASNIITLSVSSIPYTVTGGQLVIDNGSNLKSKTFTIVGQGESSSVIDAESTSRVFEIVGTNSGLSVVIQGLAIDGGRATTTAASPGRQPRHWAAAC